MYSSSWKGNAARLLERPVLFRMRLTATLHLFRSLRHSLFTGGIYYPWNLKNFSSAFKQTCLSTMPPRSTIRSSSRSSQVRKLSTSSRKDKIRKGKVVKCWTDEEVHSRHFEFFDAIANLKQESFLFRSRRENVPYKQIADSLNKTDLACRLHWHHMNVGRKGHRVDELEDDNLEESAGSSPSTVQNDETSPPLYQVETPPSLIQTPSLSPHVGPPTTACRLPSFDSFLQTTFQSEVSHRRCYSTPQAMSSSVTSNSANKEASLLTNGTRGSRTLSGTWLRDHGTSPTRLWAGYGSQKETTRPETQNSASPRFLSPGESLRRSPNPST